MLLYDTFRSTSPLVTLAVATALGASAHSAFASPERFRLSPGSVMMNDDAGYDGTTGQARGLNYEVVQGYAIAEGDMVLGRIGSDGRLDAPFQSRGLGQASGLDRWPEGVVPYAYHPGLSEIQQGKVEEAIERINSRTRVTLVETTDPAAQGYVDYVLFEPSNGCASYVGRQKLRGQDHQPLWVADSCSVGSVVHEISHAIGLFHEHTRADRDNFITVALDNIDDAKAFNFEIYDAGATMHGTYDYGSIMHYGEHYFTKNGKRTIIAPEGTRIGQREALSSEDVAAIDAMYATDLTLTASSLDTDRGLEIDLSIDNIGELGARELTLRIMGDPGTDWVSVSADSGWDCLAHEAELRCERSKLIEQANSRFTVVADAGTTGADALALRLESRTLDSNPDNNGINDDVFGDATAPEGGTELGAAEPIGAASSDDDDAGQTNEQRSTPGFGAANGVSMRAENQSAAADTDVAAAGGSGGGGGGAVGFGMGALFLPLLARIRRRRPTA